MRDTAAGNDFGPVWSLLGPGRSVTRGIAAFVVIGSAVQAGWPVTGVDRSWSTAAAWVGVTVCVVVLLMAPGDPLPARWTAVVTGLGSVAGAFALVAVPGPIVEPTQIWASGALTIVYTILCLRRRIGAAWMGTAALVGVSVGWSAGRGLGVGYGLSFSLIAVGPMVMATFFTLGVLPAAGEIFALRRESTRRAADEAAAAASLAERDRQFVRYDRLVRPTLERIADGGPFRPAEIADFAALEAHLRDLVRAPGLVHADLDAAVWEVRRRGVAVRLHDAHALDAAESAVRETIRRRIIAEVSRIESGTVTVRILPPGRTHLASVVADGAAGVRRIDFLPDGAVVEDTDGRY